MKWPLVGLKTYSPNGSPYSRCQFYILQGLLSLYEYPGGQVNYYFFKYFAGSVQFDQVSILVRASIASEVKEPGNCTRSDLRRRSFCRNPWPHRRKMETATLSPKGTYENCQGISVLATDETDLMGKFGFPSSWAFSCCDQWPGTWQSVWFNLLLWTNFFFLIL